MGKSGTGVYTTTVDVPADWLGRGRGLLLQPGAFGGTLRAWINGEQAAVPTSPGESPRDVTALLRSGRNELRVEIATTLNNAMRTHALTGGDPLYARYAGRTNQRYGLLGPVRLVPVAEAAIAVRGASRRCLSRRRFAIHVRVPRGFKPGTAVMRVGNKSRKVQVRRRAGRRLQLIVDLRERPKGTVRVRLTVRGRDGRVVRSTRTYRLCGSRS